MTVKAWLPVLAAVCLAGCASKPSHPDLGELYTKAATAGEEQRNPVIVIPGILGSRLVEKETGRVVWGAFAGDYANPNNPEDARLIAHPMKLGSPLYALQDDVVPDGALDRVKVNVLVLPVELSAYAEILEALGVGGYRDKTLGEAGAVVYNKEHYTCFQFDYDWRRDIVENARRFDQFVERTAAYIRGVRGSNQPIRFDVVAHSMGGMLARYYLRYGSSDLPADGSVPRPTWRGAARLENVILVGTPNGGSVEAIRNLVEGVSIGPFLPTYEPALLGTMPAIYQLLPRPRHGAVVDAATGEPIEDNLYDVETWRRRGWGLADPVQDGVLRTLLPDETDPDERRRIALDHLDKCLRRARQVHAALDLPIQPPDGVRLKLIAGDAKPTAAVLAVDPATGRLSTLRHAPGDGTVTRASALLDERVGGTWTPRLQTPIGWDGVFFLFTDHLGLTRDPAFTDNVLFVLLEEPR